MTVWARTDQGDMLLPTVGSGQSALVTDPDAATTIKLSDRYQLVEGEYFLDPTAGFPWPKVRVRNPNLIAIRQLLRNYALACPRVARVVDVALTYAPTLRNLAYALKATTITGSSVPVNGTAP